MADFIVEGSSPINPDELEQYKNAIKSALDNNLGAAEKNLIDTVSSHVNSIEGVTLNLKSASSMMQWYQRQFESTDTNTPDPTTKDRFGFLEDPRWSKDSRQVSENPSSITDSPSKIKGGADNIPSQETQRPAENNDWILPESINPSHEVKDAIGKVDDWRISLNKLVDLAESVRPSREVKDALDKVDSSGNLPTTDNNTQLENFELTAEEQKRILIENIKPLLTESDVSGKPSNNFDGIIPPSSAQSVDTLDDVFVNDVLDAGNNLNEASEHVINAARVIEDAADTLDDVIDNVEFPPSSGEGGDGGGGGDDDDPYELPDDDDDRPRRPRRPEETDEDDGFNLEDIVGKTGKFAVQAYLGKIVANTIGAIANSIGSAINQAGQTIVQSIGSPESASPINQVTAPVRTSAEIVGSTGALVGAGIGTAIAPGPGTVIGGLIGSVIGDKFTAAVGGVLDILISIDDNIKNLANDLRPFSVDILAASVENSLAQLQARMNQAQELGPLLAENIRARTQFELAIRDLGTEMSRLFLPFLTSLTKLSTEILEAITGNLKKLIAIIEGMLTAIGTQFPWLSQFVTGVISALKIISANTTPQKTPAQLKEIQDFIEQSAMGQINAGTQGAGPGPNFLTLPGTLGITF